MLVAVAVTISITVAAVAIARVLVASVDKNRHIWQLLVLIDFTYFREGTAVEAAYAYHEYRTVGDTCDD